MIELLFNIANLFVLPFWVLMIFLPNWGVTRRVMQFDLPFVVLAGLYVYLFASNLTTTSAQDFASAQLADIARLFSNEAIAATGWVHYLVMDLFVGRWIYWEGQRTGVWTVHSLALCLFAGPMGLLSHLITSWIWRGKAAEVAESPSNSTPESTPDSTQVGSST